MLNRDSRIDALRGIAVATVVLLHTQNAWYLGAGGDLLVGDRMHMRDHILGIASIPFSFGFLGLNLFFVLSGLCIHLWWLKCSQAGDWQFKFGKYFRRRLTRLYPAYFGAVVFSLVMLGLTEWLRLDVLGRHGLSIQAGNVIEQTLRYLTFTHTLKAETFTGYNGPLYTMAIEFQFYLLYPFVLLAFRQIGPVGTLLVTTGISVAASVWVIILNDPGIMRVVLDSAVVRWPEWIVGCLMAEWLVRWRSTGVGAPLATKTFAWLGVGTFVVATLIQIKSGISPNLLWTASIAPFVVLFLQGAAIPTSAGFVRLCWLGTISYSIYLIHMPILRFFAVILTPQPADLGINLLIYATVALPLVLSFSYLLFKFLEEPFLMARFAPLRVRAAP